jgi:glutamyl-tRNA reductase
LIFVDRYKLLNTIQIIAFTHRQFNFDEIGLFHLDDRERIDTLTNLKTNLDIDELMYLSTCNRVEFIISQEKKITRNFVEKLIKQLLADQLPTNFKNIVDRVEIINNKAAVHHIFSVASSIDSLVVGEREIITQVRKAFEECRENNLCGDVIRVLVQSTIFTAKKVYTESNIGTRPVSIVSLAFLEMKKYISKKPKKIIVIGAGKTVNSMLKFISKNQQHHYTIYNRSTEKAHKLVEALNIDADVHPLTDLADHSSKFDFIISCTGSKEIVLSLDKFQKISPDNTKSVIVDLAVPNDCDTKISEKQNVKLINVNQLKVRAEENLHARAEEIKRCLDIIDRQIIKYYIAEKERNLERALSSVPKSIKGIRQKAFREVFAKELETLDPGAIEVVNSLVDYIEKKYISVPMKMAKEILLKETTK